MIIIINMILTILMTYFVMNIYQQIPQTGLFVLSVFAGWGVVFWLFSFFYSKKAFYKLPKILGLILFYLKDLVVSSLLVAYEVVTPKDYMRPGIIALPLDAKTDLEITLLAHMITLTPGSLTIDVSVDRKIMYIHEVFLTHGDIEKKKAQIKAGFERRILNITR